MGRTSAKESCLHVSCNRIAAGVKYAFGSVAMPGDLLRAYADRVTGGSRFHPLP